MTKCLIKMMLKHFLAPCLCVPVILIYQTLFEDFVNTTLHRNKPECTCMHNNARLVHQITFSDIHFDHIYLCCTCFEFSFELFLNNNKFMNHPQISAILDDEEEECLHYLTTVRIKVGQECSYTCITCFWIDYTWYYKWFQNFGGLPYICYKLQMYIL